MDSNKKKASKDSSQLNDSQYSDNDNDDSLSLSNMSEKMVKQKIIKKSSSAHALREKRTMRRNRRVTIEYDGAKEDK